MRYSVKSINSCQRNGEKKDNSDNVGYVTFGAFFTLLLLLFLPIIETSLGIIQQIRMNTEFSF